MESCIPLSYQPGVCMHVLIMHQCFLCLNGVIECTFTVEHVALRSMTQIYSCVHACVYSIFHKLQMFTTIKFITRAASRMSLSRGFPIEW